LEKTEGHDKQGVQGDLVVLDSALPKRRGEKKTGYDGRPEVGTGATAPLVAQKKRGVLKRAVRTGGPSPNSRPWYRNRTQTA